MADFAVSGRNYKSAKMDAMKQGHVARRVFPIVAAVPEVLSAIRRSSPPDPIEGEDVVDGDAAFEAIERTVSIIIPLMNALTKMSDEETEYVIGTCMAICSREEPNGAWAPIWSLAAKRPMFDDINFVDMMAITANVIWAELEGFFPGGLSIFRGATMGLGRATRQ